MNTAHHHALLPRRSFLRRCALAGATAAVRPWLRAAGPVDRPVGVALLGLGRYSAGQLGPALRESRLCRLAGVVTGSPEKAAQWARDYGLSPKSLYSYDTFDRIAENPDIDVVYVVTPPGVHREFVERAARAGKHVICEKPMATTVADCDAMIRACAKADVQLSIGYRLHFDPSHLEVARLAREGDFGVLRSIEGDRGFRVDTPRWRLTQALGGGGPLMDVGIYIINAACLAAGATPFAVTGREEPKTRPELFTEVEETMHFTMEFPDGIRCAAVTSFSRASNRFRAEGARGWIELEPAFAYRGIQVTTSRGPVAFAGPNQQALHMDDFAECIRTGRPTAVPGEMGRRDVQIIRAIYRAAATGERVSVTT